MITLVKCFNHHNVREGTTNINNKEYEQELKAYEKEPWEVKVQRMREIYIHNRITREDKQNGNTRN